jgi:hypothetical protein
MLANCVIIMVVGLLWLYVYGMMAVVVHHYWDETRGSWERQLRGSDRR